MYHAHPEILVRPLGGEYVGYGMRQNMDTDDPSYRSYAQRLIRNLVAHYRDNPAVIGWQLDNETASYGASNPDAFAGFVEHLKRKFGTVEKLNQAWLLNYWGQDVDSWEHMPTRDNAQSTGYKLEWSRWQQMRVTNFLAWQADLVRQYKGASQFVTQDFAGAMHRDVDESAVARSLDIAAANAYHGTQDHMDGESQSDVGDFIRSLKHDNYLLTETNGQTIGWNSAGQFPPYDGQLRLDVYTHLSSGANMVGYWHWHSLHSGQETYWKGVLGHDLEPGRAYAEVSRTARELQKIGPHLVNLKIRNKVAVLYSPDSWNALDFMPFAQDSRSQRSGGAGYAELIHQFHRILYQQNVGVDYVFPQSASFSGYKLLIVPALYIADDALLSRIADFVRGGGHVLMTFKSGFCDENSMVRHVRQPGPLREAAGFSYQEFSNLERPLALKGDPYKAGDANKVMHWAEFLIPEHAQALAQYDHPFFGRWPAITRNQYGAGTLTYEGTWLSDALQKNVLLDVLGQAGLTGPDQNLPAPVHVKHGVNDLGRHIHYYLNYSSDAHTLAYPYGLGTDLLTGNSVRTSQQVSLGPWDVAIVEEK
jgi:beta-galactosidase